MASPFFLALYRFHCFHFDIFVMCVGYESPEKGEMESRGGNENHK